mmetsp:Transcript_9233/g.27490  ORF Transcript_9233/g.27490 Transcript_9233/m.27490 type:complete len:294 (-) Transcript_9233:1030-1911(-)
MVPITSYRTPSNIEWYDAMMMVWCRKWYATQILSDLSLSLVSRSFFRNATCLLASRRVVWVDLQGVWCFFVLSCRERLATLHAWRPYRPSWLTNYVSNPSILSSGLCLSWTMVIISFASSSPSRGPPAPPLLSWLLEVARSLSLPLISSLPLICPEPSPVVSSGASPSPSWLVLSLSLSLFLLFLSFPPPQPRKNPKGPFRFGDCGVLLLLLLLLFLLLLLLLWSWLLLPSAGSDVAAPFCALDWEFCRGPVTLESSPPATAATPPGVFSSCSLRSTMSLRKSDCWSESVVAA